MKTTCIRRLTFCAGHRVYGHESKCANLHGHGYQAFIHAEAPELDALGRVVDFSVIKDKVGGWLETTWDHATLLYERDPLASLLECQGYKKVIAFPTNPTAENMARYLLNKSNDLLRFSGVTVTRVDLFETENCSVTVTE